MFEKYRSYYILKNIEWSDEAKFGKNNWIFSRDVNHSTEMTAVSTRFDQQIFGNNETLISVAHY